jgi:hypothetical protein
MFFLKAIKLMEKGERKKTAVAEAMAVEEGEW